MKPNKRVFPPDVVDTAMYITSKEADIQIPTTIHKEYVAYHKRIDCKKYDVQQTIGQSKKLLLKRTPNLAVKKKLLFLLGHFAIKECFEILKDYLNDPKTPLKDWAILCLKDLQLTVESQFSDEDTAFIMSPLGGKNNMGRCCVVIGSKQNKILDTKDKLTIIEDLYKTTKQYAQVEKAIFGKNYIWFMILISFDTAPQMVIDAFLDVVSKEKGILKYHFFMVNTHNITKKEIREYLAMEEVKKL